MLDMLNIDTEGFIDTKGFNYIDGKPLLAIIDKFTRALVELNNLAVPIDEERNFVEDVIEHF